VLKLWDEERIKKHMEDKKGGRVLNFDSALFYPHNLVVINKKEKNICDVSISF